LLNNLATKGQWNNNNSQNYNYQNKYENEKFTANTYNSNSYSNYNNFDRQDFYNGDHSNHKYKKTWFTRYNKFGDVKQSIIKENEEFFADHHENIKKRTGILV